MSERVDSIPVRVLTKLASWVYERPAWFIYPQILLFAAAVYFTITNLQFSTARSDLVGSEKKYHQLFLKYKRDFNVRDDFVAVVESEDREKNRQFVERLGAKLEKETNLFSEVFYKGDLKMLGPKALLFLDEETLMELKARLHEYRPFIAQFSTATNLNSLFQLINNQFRAAALRTNQEPGTLVDALPALERILAQAAYAAARPGMPPSPGLTALFGPSDQAEEEQYITFAQGRIYLVNARVISDKLSSQGVNRLRELVAETRDEVPGVNVGITGEPVLEHDEMRQSQKDSTLASIVALGLCALLFVFSYRETGRPVKATASLVLGLGYTMGYATLAVGHLNILTITFLPILIGLAIDFGIHLITRYEEELRHGATPRLALERAMVNTGLGIFTGCFTTAGAFFAMAFTDFKGIQEMGIITGGGILVCLIPMMTFLPALVLRGRQNIIDTTNPPAESTRARLEKLWLTRPVPVVAAAFVLSVLAIVPLRKVYFDYNLLHMQSRGLNAVVFEHKLIQAASKSVLYGVVIASNSQEAIQLESAITNLPSVASVDSMAPFLVADQSRRLRLIQEIKEEVAPIRFAPVDPEPVNSAELSRTLYSLHGYLGLALEALGSAHEPTLEAQLRALRTSVEDLRYELRTGNPLVIAERLGAFQRALFKDLRETFRALRTQDSSSPLREEDLPRALRNRFIGTNGQHLLQVYPKGNVWERQPQEEFIQDLRSVVPDSTGTPVQLYEYTTLLKDSYVKAAFYSLGAIVILVFLHFRRISSVLLALLPVALGTLWMAAIMGAFGIPLNPANIMTLPLVIGIGVTNGIHILNRFSEEQNPGILAKSTGKAVIVSAFTTIAGFGSLILAKHQGIQSLGLVMSLGVGMCMVAAITVLPAVLMLLRGSNSGKKGPSDDNAQSTLGREEPR